LAEFAATLLDTLQGEARGVNDGADGAGSNTMLRALCYLRHAELAAAPDAVEKDESVLRPLGGAKRGYKREVFCLAGVSCAAAQALAIRNTLASESPAPDDEACRALEERIAP